MKKNLCTSVCLVASLAVAIPAFAVDELGLFELDGNATDEPASGDDWATLDSGGGGAFVFTLIEPDFPGLAGADPLDNIFDGGRKDIQPISKWSWGTGSNPPKAEITNAYAAAYKCPPATLGCTAGDLIIYFGADRTSHVGDTFLGFWFFKDDVKAVDGDFTGEHKNGDVLVLVNFPQKAGAVPLVQVIKWDDTCQSKDSTSPIAGQCAATNLRLVAGASGAGAVCTNTGAPGAQQQCAITNEEGGVNDPTSAPWDYIFKGGVSTDFPFETFFEGGINISQLFPGADTCFASFMAETRSSSEFGASLKDFVLDSFPVCAVEFSKQCGTGTFNATTGNLEIPYTVTVNNVGSGTVNSVIASDDDCGFGSGTTLNFGPLLPNTDETKSGTCIIPAGTDLTGGVSNGVTAVADNGTVTVIPASSCVTNSSAPGKCFSACSFNLSPDIGATKSCLTSLLAEGGVVKVKVNFSGTVTNTSNLGAAPVPLTNVVASDDKAGTLTLTDSGGTPLSTPVTLDPGETAYFEGSYLPDGSGLGFSTCPSDADFADTVTASGDDVFTGASVIDVAPATCNLCADGDCPAP
jgi:hypothetical protein